MTDPELVAKKLAFIETCVRDLRTLARPERIADDLREERFVEHTLQLAIQAALDAGSHIVSDERLGEPETRTWTSESFGTWSRTTWATCSTSRRRSARSCSLPRAGTRFHRSPGLQRPRTRRGPSSTRSKARPGSVPALSTSFE